MTCTCTQPTCEHCGEFSETGRGGGNLLRSALIWSVVGIAIWTAFIWLVLS